MQTFIASGGPQSPARGLFASLLPAIAPKSFKAALADEIERMIDMLDTLDGDTDLEETGDLEPSLGGYTRGYDLELDTSDDELGGDENEPSLASLNGTAPFHLGTMANWTSQTNWAGGGLADRELDTVDDEEGGDDEPDDSGIGDQDGLLEATGAYDGPCPRGRSYFEKLQDHEEARQAGYRLRCVAARRAGLPAPPSVAPRLAIVTMIDGFGPAKIEAIL